MKLRSSMAPLSLMQICCTKLTTRLETIWSWTNLLVSFDFVCYNIQQFLAEYSLCIVTLPSIVNLAGHFLEDRIRTLIRQCVEHGIWLALERAANHLQKLDQIRRQMKTVNTNAQSAPSDTMFEYWLLAFGWFCGFVVFCVELVLGAC